MNTHKDSQILIAVVSPEAQQLGDSMDFLGDKLDDTSSTILPVALACLGFGVMAYVVKRFIYSG